MGTRTFKRPLLSLNLSPIDSEILSCESPKSSVAKITPYLSLGSEEDAAGDLKKLGITHLLNVSISSPNIVSKGVKYKKIPLKDHASETVVQILDEAFTFIDEAKKANGHILVYCFAGISRSVTITVAYLMARNGMRFEEAYSFVKHRKSDISPNIGFIGQLHELEEQLLSSPDSTQSD